MTTETASWSSTQRSAASAGAVSRGDATHDLARRRDAGRERHPREGLTHVEGLAVAVERAVILGGEGGRLVVAAGEQPARQGHAGDDPDAGRPGGRQHRVERLLPEAVEDDLDRGDRGTRDRGQGLGAGLDAHAVGGDAPLRDQRVERVEHRVAVVHVRRRAVQLHQVEGVDAEVCPAAIGPAAEARPGCTPRRRAAGHAAPSSWRPRARRRAARAAAGRSRRSLRPSPYTSAVSMNVTPASTAACSVARASVVGHGPQSAPICHAPSPTIPIRRPVLPSTRCSTAAPLSSAARPCQRVCDGEAAFAPRRSSTIERGPRPARAKEVARCPLPPHRSMLRSSWGRRSRRAPPIPTSPSASSCARATAPGPTGSSATSACAWRTSSSAGSARSTTRGPAHVAMLLENHLELLALYGGCALRGLTLFGVNTGLRGDDARGRAQPVARARSWSSTSGFWPEVERVRGELKHVAPENILVAAHRGRARSTPRDLRRRARARGRARRRVARRAGGRRRPRRQPDGHLHLGHHRAAEGHQQQPLQAAARSAWRCRGNLGLGADDVGYACMPLFHSNAMFVGFMPAFWVGGSIAHARALQRQPVRARRAALRRHATGTTSASRCTTCSPRSRRSTAATRRASAREMTEQPAEPVALRRRQRRGAARHRPLHATGWGSRTCSSSTARPRRRSAPSAARAIRAAASARSPTPAVKILNERGEECPPARARPRRQDRSTTSEAVGEICRVAPDTGLFQGYFDNPKANAGEVPRRRLPLGRPRPHRRARRHAATSSSTAAPTTGSARTARTSPRCQVGAPAPGAPRRRARRRLRRAVRGLGRAGDGGAQAARRAPLRPEGLLRLLRAAGERRRHGPQVVPRLRAHGRRVRVHADAEDPGAQPEEACTSTAAAWRTSRSTGGGAATRRSRRSRPRTTRRCATSSRERRSSTCSTAESPAHAALPPRPRPAARHGSRGGAPAVSAVSPACGAHGSRARGAPRALGLRRQPGPSRHLLGPQRLRQRPGAVRHARRRHDRGDVSAARRDRARPRGHRRRPVQRGLRAQLHLPGGHRRQRLPSPERADPQDGRSPTASTPRRWCRPSCRSATPVDRETPRRWWSIRSAPGCS